MKALAPVSNPTRPWRPAGLITERDAPCRKFFPRAPRKRYISAIMPSPQSRSAAARPAQKATHRIAKLLARAGVASRREIERMIAEGRVAVDGRVIDTPATLLASLNGVTVDGNPVKDAEPARLFLYHKPNGLLVTERDPRGRPTIYDRLPRGLPRVVPVGRLDLNTEGLLLLTTDGELKRQLELPSTGVQRAYRARAYGNVTQAQLEELIEGVEIDGVRYGAIDANMERRTGANVWIELVLTEGKNREVRRVLEHLGLKVSRLIRTRYGPFVLGDLPVGAVGEVRGHDIESFRKNPTRLDLPQPARRQSRIHSSPPAEGPGVGDAQRRSRVSATDSPTPPPSLKGRGSKKNGPRQRADGTLAVRPKTARADRARTFRAERGEAAPASPAAASRPRRPGGRPPRPGTGTPRPGGARPPRKPR